jgi:hypothetical protein
MRREIFDIDEQRTGRRPGRNSLAPAVPAIGRVW